MQVASLSTPSHPKIPPKQAKVCVLYQQSHNRDGNNSNAHLRRRERSEEIPATRLWMKNNEKWVYNSYDLLKSINLLASSSLLLSFSSSIAVAVVYRSSLRAWDCLKINKSSAHSPALALSRLPKWISRISGRQINSTYNPRLSAKHRKREKLIDVARKRHERPFRNSPRRERNFCCFPAQRKNEANKSSV